MKESIGSKFFKVYRLLFYLFLGGTLAFGRSFSILHLKTNFFPLFITEIILLISLPFLFVSWRKIFELPRIFLITLTIYSFFSLFYLVLGILSRNPYALRDIVLSGYTLFIFLSFVIFSHEKQIKQFIFILALANLIGMIAGRIFIINIGSPEFQKSIIYTIKPTNFGLNYGIAIAFLISFFAFVKKRLFLFLMLFALTLNLYLLFIMGIRTLWLAGFFEVVFLFLILKIRNSLALIKLFPLMLLIFGVLYTLDQNYLMQSKEDIISKRDIILTKIQSLKFFIANPVTTNDGLSNQPQRFSKISGFDKYKKNGSDESSVSVKVETPQKVPRKFAEFFDSIIWRLNLWKQAIDFGMENPLLGRGFGVYPAYILWGYFAPGPKKFDLDSGVTPTHNHLVTIFYKMGFLGLGLFLLINIYTLIFALRYLKKCNLEYTRFFLIGLLGAFLFWHLEALFYDIIDSPPTNIFLWIIMGLIFAAIKTDKEDAASSQKPNKCLGK